MLRRMLVVLPLFLMVVVVGCGGDDSSGSAATSSDAPASDSNQTQQDSSNGDKPAVGSTAEPPAPAASGDAGVIQLDGKSFDVSDVRRCKPFFDGEGNLDLTAIGNGVMLFININESGSSVSHELSLQGANAGGVFSGAGTQAPNRTWFDDNGDPLAGPPFTINGDHISGGLTVIDARGGPDTVDVTFDVSIPSDIVDCSL